MKKMLMLTLFLLTLFGVIGGQTKKSQRSDITFEHLNHNFGTLPRGGEEVTHLFEFTNNSTAPLIITRATTSCRCITVKYPKRPVAAGSTSHIEVSYDPKDAGAFNKTIDIHANIHGGIVTLLVTGIVEEN